MLSQDEQRHLFDIGRRLSMSDPALARHLRTGSADPHATEGSVA